MPTLNLIMPLLNESNDQVVCTLVDCVASMAKVEGRPIRYEKIMSIIDTILPFLSETNIIEKRLATLRCLSELSENYSYVIHPYRNHPLLLPSLLNCVSEPELGEVASQVLGRFGALDPFQAREILEDKKATEVRSDFLNLNQMVSSDNRRPDEKFNIRVTIHCISKLIQPKAEGVDSHSYQESLKKLLSGFEQIIRGRGILVYSHYSIHTKSLGQTIFNSVFFFDRIVHHIKNHFIS